MFSQSPYACRMEWGRRGAREAADRGDIIIIVDILSFSSTVVSALHYGSVIYPYPPYVNGKEYAKEINAEYILGRAEAAKAGKPTLSPVTFNEEHSNKRYVLSSLNGAFCTWIASKAQALFAGSLLNAEAVASAANQLRLTTKANITVIPCGEQWSYGREEEDTLRPAIEDYLGAGAILSYLEGEKSPEAEVCMGAFLQAKPKLNALIWDCGSGRELRERGFASDVEHCRRLNVYQTVPVLKNNHFVSYHGEL
ncbi:2-phosphosulfolactate phosphatase [Neobacillus sp. DY30]|uniref:2-phosphosulfolactate phosphatase n=1 Tax=Neobacillus sp. DY30 TaxID=3047871 RepID=UPI0024BFB9F4|nr:2-phosphosulfolactate phosphatase [Neobacillus sp. DY30]WHY01585.1 2-phosphosulfolactate phosphatase [Neobacillus sp. DY30]